MYFCAFNVLHKKCIIYHIPFPIAQILIFTFLLCYLQDTKTRVKQLLMKSGYAKLAQGKTSSVHGLRGYFVNKCMI